MRRWFLFFLLLLFILWRWLARKSPRGDVWKRFSRIQKRRDRFLNQKPLVKDPQCGIYIPKDRALSHGKHFFCSEECLTQWLTKQQSSTT